MKYFDKKVVATAMDGNTVAAKWGPDPDETSRSESRPDFRQCVFALEKPKLLANFATCKSFSLRHSG